MILPQAYRRTYGIGILTAGVLMGGALLLLHPRMQPSYWERPEALWEIDETHDPRTNIWKLAWEQPSDYMAHGLGAGQNTGYLMERYKEHHLYIYTAMHFHCHNQYLEELMELGIGGLLLFLLAWASIPLCAKGIGKQTAWLFCLMMLLNMFTDCIFSTFCGVALWAVSLILIRLQSDGAGE